MRVAQSQLSSKVDVENQRDFYQYYKGRYFGTCPEPFGPTYPSVIDHNKEPGQGKICFNYFNPETKAFLPVVADLVVMNLGSYRFGAPVLGTAAFGPTYAYVEGQSLRESVKGIAISKFQIKVPNSGFILKKYAAKEPSLVKMLGPYFGSVEEMEFVYGIYNKKYYSWNEALDLLEKGERLGCQLSKHTGVFLDEQEPCIQLSYKQVPAVAKITPSRDRFAGRYTVEVMERFQHLKPILEHILFPLNDQITIK